MGLEFKQSAVNPCAFRFTNGEDRKVEIPLLRPVDDTIVTGFVVKVRWLVEKSNK